jgi:hypothetical protein
MKRRGGWRNLRRRLVLVVRRVDANRGNVTSLEINLDADQCRVLDLGLHVINVSPRPVPNIDDLPRDRCAPSRHLDSSHFLRRQRFAPTAPRVTQPASAVFVGRGCPRRRRSLRPPR